MYKGYKNIEKRKQYMKEYNKKYIPKWIEKNRDKWNKLQRKIHKKQRMITREKLFELLGDKCVRCGFSDKRALQFDHINGGGLKDIKNKTKRKKVSDSYYKYYLNHPEEAKTKLQVLCANCNWIKKYENNEK